MLFGSVSSSRRCRPKPTTTMGSFSAALEAINVSTELVEEELKPHMDTVLAALLGGREGAAKQIVASGILPTLAHALWRKNGLTTLTARLVAELARDASLRDCCVKAGLASALLNLLRSSDQEILLHTGRAISRISFDSSLRQDQLIQGGVIPLLVEVMLRYPENGPLVHACLLALCNVADMGEEDGSSLVWEEGEDLGKGERVYRGVLKHSLGFSSAVTTVRLTGWSHSQHAVSVEVTQRCAAVLWGAGGRWRTVRRFPFGSLGACPNFYKVIRYGVQNVPKSTSLKSRIFHAFL